MRLYDQRSEAVRLTVPEDDRPGMVVLAPVFGLALWALMIAWVFL